MVGVYVAFIRVVYGRMIYMSLPTYYIHSNVYFLTVDMPEMLWQPVPAGNRDSGTRVQNIYPSQP